MFVRNDPRYDPSLCVTAMKPRWFVLVCVFLFAAALWVALWSLRPERGRLKARLPDITPIFNWGEGIHSN